MQSMPATNSIKLLSQISLICSKGQKICKEQETGLSSGNFNP